MHPSATRTRSAPAPLWLLVRINSVQAWRRLLSIRHQSRLMTAVIGLFIAGYLWLSFWLFHSGLGFVAKFPGLGVVLTERLLYVLFAFLFALLLLSNLVISYTNFFRNREATFLFTLPLPAQTILRWKFIESTLLASWAFLFLIAPLLVAFGIVRDVSWHFYALTLALTALFIVLPGVAGVWLAMTVARFLDRRTFQIGVVMFAALLLWGAAFWWRTQPATEDMLEIRTIQAMDQLLVKTHFTLFPFLPSYWLTSSVLNWADGVLSAAGFFALVLLSHALFFGCLAFTRWGDYFYEAASAVQSRASVWSNWAWLRERRKTNNTPVPGPGFVERVCRPLDWFGRDIRALVVKDIRTFWRDTTQWGQSVMLFGLLGAYIINLRNFTHQLTNPFWINLVAHLNLFACALNLATLTTRFVFPQFSLEGRRLWIVGMAPMGLARVVLTKFLLASAMSLVITAGLIALSCYMLRMTWDRVAFYAGVVAVMTFALNGLAVGLGVLYPNFKDANPGKIVSGFGGTLCLVMSFLYILASVFLIAYGTTGRDLQFNVAMTSVSGFAVLSFLAGWLPLKLGLRQLGKIEV